MPWFSLKLLILSPLLCLFCPVLMILHGLWEGEDLPVHQTTSGFCGRWDQRCHLTGLLGLWFLPRHYYEREHRLFIEHPPDQKPTPAGWQEACVP